MADKMHVYEAIAQVTEAMSKEGIGKNNKNAMQGYKFRGIDDVLNALSPLLAKHKLNILPRVMERDCVERITAKGGAIFYVTVKSEFDFVSAVDGSKHTVATYGEAMDSADKATNKAMSAAYKYAAFQAFCIPTEGDNDADASHHEVKPQVRGGTSPEDLAQDWPLEARKKTVDDLMKKLMVVEKEKLSEAKTYSNKIVKNLRFVKSDDLADELQEAIDQAVNRFKEENNVIGQ